MIDGRNSHRGFPDGCISNMEVFTVSFFGHRIVTDYHSAEKRLEHLIVELLNKETYVEFLVGRDGEFDQLISSTVRRCKRSIRNDNSSLVWVLPYETAELRENKDTFREYYDEIEICDRASIVHFKAAHQIRNRQMVDRSDLIVFYVERNSGGAYQTLRYAKKQKKAYINISDNSMEDSE